MAPGGDLPAVFSVGANVANVRGGGHLTIDRGRIVLEFGPMLSRAAGVSKIVHERSEVTLIRARLGLPWMNTSVVVTGEGQVGIATTWFGARHRLRSALEGGGFVVRDAATWISPGELWRYARG
jgi:hypothetical protein